LGIVETEVMKPHEINKSQGSLSLFGNQADLIGTVRGITVRLYTVSAEASESTVQEPAY
jgi:hypothetical protein